MNDQNDTGIFEKYLKGELSGKEWMDFQNKLENNASWKKEFEDFLFLTGQLKKNKSIDEIRNQLEHLHVEWTMERAGKRGRKLTRILRIHSATIAVAASVTLIVLFGSILVINYINSFRSQQQEFIRLRREVAQIQRSQKDFIATLHDSKKDPVPGNFAGTGFLLNRDGYLLTCYHLVKNQDSLMVRNKKYGNLKAYLVKFHMPSDLALLQIRDSSFTGPKNLPVLINLAESGLGESVYTLGYPKPDIVYSEGVVSSVTGYNGDTTAYQISLPLNPGNSGGPLINQSGNIIGVVNGKDITEEGSAFALKSSYLKNFLEDPSDSLNQIKINWTRKNAGSTLPKTQQIKQLSDYVFEVKVFEE